MFNILHVVADLILLSNYSINNLTINKLLYFFYGCYLVEENLKAFSESPEAWMYGPVFPVVYRTLKFYGENYITPEQVEQINFGDECYYKNHNNEHVKFLKQVYNHLKSFNCNELTYLTCRNNGAWDIMYDWENFICS